MNPATTELVFDFDRIATRITDAATGEEIELQRLELVVSTRLGEQRAALLIDGNPAECLNARLTIAKDQVHP